MAPEVILAMDEDEIARRMAPEVILAMDEGLVLWIGRGTVRLSGKLIACAILC